ncbi:hypothetical protein B9Z55_008709 [Caenorhabditis nigoni]|uniref:Domain of unknown function WSN domain-containing protein n=1 Tax=Caenorhabditis nigoni TaxID=1611254 RepID=A0A2G5UPC2_9PELO|nr:hypothetical protein B9Z55_008709 [Caenorhabditis nigoni]
MYSIPLLVLAISSITSSTESVTHFSNTDKIDNRFLGDSPSLDLSFVSNAVGNSPTPEVIQNLARLARVVTSISLQIGLSDGSIPVDDVIAELLNIEPKDLKNLETFDPKNSEQFFTELNKMKQSGEVADVKDALMQMFELKELWKSVDLSKMPNEASYKKLGDLKSIDASRMTKVKFDELKKMIAKEPVEVDNLKTSLGSLVTSVETIKGNTETFIQLLNQLKPLTSLSQILTLYPKIGNLNMGNRKPTDKNLLETDFEALKNLKTLSQQSSLNVIFASVSSRYVYRHTEKIYTSGFVNGFKDLENVSSDKKDKWINQVPAIPSHLDGLEELDKVREQMMTLDGKWSSVANQETYTSLKHVADLYKMLAGDLPSKTDVEAITNGIYKCATVPTQAATEAVTKVATNTGILLRKLSSIHRLRQFAEKIKSEFIPKLSAKISKEELKEISNLVVKMELDAKIVQEGDSFDKIDMKTDLPGNIVDYAENNRGTVKSFDCIKDLDSGFEKVASAARALIEIRKVQKVLKNVQSASEAISGSSESFKTIRAALENIKKNTDSKLKALSDLKNISKPFGEAVTALVLSDVVSRRSSDFETFVNNGYLLENQVDADKSPEFLQEFKAEWGDFRSTAQDINSMFAGITSWLEKLKVSNSSLPLSEVGSIFEKLPNLVDVDLVTDRRLIAIESFENEKKTTPDQKKQLEEFKKSLLDLSKLDLKFARFQSSATQMPDTITRLLKILEEAKAKETASLKADEEKNDKTTMVVTIICVLGGLGMIGVILMTWQSIARSRKPKAQPEEKKKKKDDKNKTATTTSTTTVMDETKN